MLYSGSIFFSLIYGVMFSCGELVTYWFALIHSKCFTGIKFFR